MYVFGYNEGVIGKAGWNRPNMDRLAAGRGDIVLAHLLGYGIDACLAELMPESLRRCIMHCWLPHMFVAEAEMRIQRARRDK